LIVALSNATEHIKSRSCAIFVMINTYRIYSVVSSGS